MELKAALIGFHRIRGNHTGKVLAHAVLYLLDWAEVTLKIGWFTLDNASNNKKMMEELSSMLALHEIEFHPTDRRIMCFPHIINICTQHILHAFHNVDRGRLQVDTIF